MSVQTELPVFSARARTFWFAARFLPAYMRASVGQLYAFARAIDDLVDKPGELAPDEIRSILRAWRSWLEAPASPETAPDPRVASLVLPVLVDRGVPVRYLQLLVDGVASDLDRCAMASWADLREYCFQVASSVGLAMCHLLGAGDDPLACQAAVDLGIAMQLTNILRDLGEDVRNGRVYLPADELSVHGFSREHLRWLASSGPDAIDDPFRRLMRAQIHRARTHYESGLEGLWRLPSDARFGILVAGRLYAAILDQIEAADYDVFSRRAATSTWDKISSAARWWLAYRLRHAQIGRLTPDAVRS